jgi:hypothetical protein
MKSNNSYSKNSQYGHNYAGTSQKNSVSAIDNFLESEKNTNISDQWCKLNKSIRLEKLKLFATEYSVKNSFSQEETIILIDFFKDCLDKKKLNKVKDVTYDKISGCVTDIPLLLFNRQSKSFTLKKTTKHVNTLKSSSKHKTNDEVPIEPVNSLNI